MKLIECVINISAGRNLTLIEEIALCGRVAGAQILHVDPGPAADRTVITLAGETEPIQLAAFNIIRSASEKIDMRRYHSVHPCIGAADVCPFVPLSNTTLEDCAACAHSLAKRVAVELDIPVYLYGAAASDPSRARLSAVRKGGYRGLAERFQSGLLPPDYGPSRLVPRTGAIAIGARKILIAFNVNLAASSETAAAQIAARIRSSAKVDPAHSNTLPLPHCQAIGWFMKEYGLAQVSTNLTDYQVTPPHLVVEAVKALAGEFGTAVTGSELIGLIPKRALLDAGLYYTRAADGAEDSLIRTAVRKLGLDALLPFDPKERILEERLALAGWTLER